MTIEEYKERINQLDLEYNKKKRELANEYAKFNCPHQVGDVVEDHIGKLKIERIRAVLPISDKLDYVYYGIELKKDGTPCKRQTGRGVYQSNVSRRNKK